LYFDGALVAPPAWAGITDPEARIATRLAIAAMLLHMEFLLGQQTSTRDLTQLSATPHPCSRAIIEQLMRKISKRLHQPISGSLMITSRYAVVVARPHTIVRTILNRALPAIIFA
jgi:hypothetical protein